MYCKADFKSIAKCKKWLCAAVFSLFLKNMRRAAWPVLQSRCKALSAPPQSTPKNTKTGRKSVGFLILTQAPKCTRSHRFPPQKHPKNGFVLRFAGKNSFLQVRSSHVLILSALLHLRNSLCNGLLHNLTVYFFTFLLPFRRNSLHGASHLLCNNMYISVIGEARTLVAEDF